jgi:hypothetical protein
MKEVRVKKLNLGSFLSFRGAVSGLLNLALMY